MIKLGMLLAGLLSILAAIAKVFRLGGDAEKKKQAEKSIQDIGVRNDIENQVGSLDDAAARERLAGWMHSDDRSAADRERGLRGPGSHPTLPG